MKKFALVTEASSSIGKEIAKQYARDAYNLVLVAQDIHGLAQAFDEIRQLRPGRGEHFTFVKDLRRPESPLEVFEELEQRGIEIDSLVNTTLLSSNVGVGSRGDFSELPLEEDIEIIHLNIEALIRFTKLFLRPMLSRGNGEILNVVSVAGFQPGPLLAICQASKAFVSSFSEALAEELKDSGVSVTYFCPGPTDSRSFKDAQMEAVRTRMVVHQEKLIVKPTEIATRSAIV